MSSASEYSAKPWSYAVIVGIIVYVAIDILLAFLRPDYSLLHNAESDYGRGPYFWVMDINFLLRCAFSLALIKAIWAVFPSDSKIKRDSYWLVAWAIASGLLAFFADNPYGYPHLRSSSVHSALAVVAFVGVLVGMFLVSKRLRGIQAWRKTAGLLIGITMLAIISLVLMKLTGFNPHKAGGLFERIFLGLVLVWEGVIATKIISVGNKFASASRKQQ
jgi:hypothetical membrane protein